MVIRNYAVILTHNRPELLEECYDAISPQVNKVIIVDNASTPPVWYDRKHPDPRRIVIRDEEQPPNIARLWNTALARIEHTEDHGPVWNIAMLCDDAIVASNWFKTVSHGMRYQGAAIGCTKSHNEIETPMLKIRPDRDMVHRMTPWAFVIAGEKRLRADEEMHIWWQDTDLDWQARAAGGMIVLPGPVAENRVPNEVFMNNSERAIQDGEAFEKKWGKKPW